MRRSASNCRDLKMETIRLRRERPSSLAFALALLITMLVVYLLSWQGCPEPAAASASSVRSETQLHLEGLDAQFLLSGMFDDSIQANVAAALCHQSGGAGLVMQEGENFAVVFSAGTDFSDADAPVIHRSAPGLTLEIDAPGHITAAVSDGCRAMFALASETGALADSLEQGGTDGRTAASLMGIYRTQLSGALADLTGVQHAAAIRICSAIENDIEHLDYAIARTEPAQLRLLHAGACLQWIQLLASLHAMV